MGTSIRSLVCAGGLLLAGVAMTSVAHAAGHLGDETSTLVCASKAGERETCPASTRGGVTIVKTLGPVACEFGHTWGYDATSVWVSDGCTAEFTIAEQTPAYFGRYTPTGGFKVADTEHGDLNIRVFTYIRYLNQLGIDSTYTNAFGRTSDVQQRQDFQVNKAQVYFFGWIMSPKFRYLTYIWTSNASQGLSAQVVVAGNLSYRFNDHLTLGAGISGLPGVRSVAGNFPYWLSVDSRAIADEYFRASYTTGLFAQGQITRGLTYESMWGNNMSQLGIDAGQLDNSLDSIAAGLVWMPTTGEFGRQSGFGDFDSHDRVATRLSVHGSRSDETRQGQPNTDGFDNVQLRVSDGSVIFSPGLFAPEVQIEEATYKMLSIDGGVKYRGFSFDAEYYRRWIGNFATRGTGTLPVEALHDTGFQIQASAMAVPQQVQVYAGSSKVFGEYGNPSDFRTGVNLYPWKNQVVRWNFEFLRVNRSPVGALSLPFSVGANGPIFHSNLMIWF